VKPVIVLDSTPLGLLVRPPGLPVVDACRVWVEKHLTAGTRIIVPEIVDYELRRELLRMGGVASLTLLDDFNAAEVDRYLPLTTSALRLAAEMWAQARRQGAPTADRHALDIDVILAAQALSSGLSPQDFVIATGNLGHLSRFTPAELWENL
jgi:predicted nucleic acid-binding protein